MSTTQLPPIESLRPGRFTSMAGQPFEFTEADLADMAAVYDPAVFRAPIVVGHPRSNSPAYGWISGMEYDSASKRLCSIPGEVDAAFADLVREKKYRNVSLSLYTPTAPNNPMPGHYYPKHLGFLGAMAPAVKGLREASFAGFEEGVVEFGGYEEMASAGLWRRLREFLISQFGAETADTVVPQYDVQYLEQCAAQEQAEAAAEATQPAAFSDTPESQPGDTDVTDKTAEFAERESSLAAREAEIAAREQKIQQAEASAKRQNLAEFAESMIQQGKVLPRDKEGLVEFMAALDGEQVIEFGEGDSHVKATPGLWFMDFVKRLPTQVEFSEMGAGDGADEINLSDPIAISQAATAYQAAQRAKGVEVSDIEAVSHITKPRS